MLSAHLLNSKPDEYTQFIHVGYSRSELMPLVYWYINSFLFIFHISRTTISNVIQSILAKYHLLFVLLFTHCFRFFFVLIYSVSCGIWLPHTAYLWKLKRQLVENRRRFVAMEWNDKILKITRNVCFLFHFSAFLLVYQIFLQLNEWCRCWFQIRYRIELSK